MLCKVSDSYLTIEDNTTISLISTARSITTDANLEFAIGYIDIEAGSYKLTSNYRLTSANLTRAGILLSDYNNDNKVVTDGELSKNTDVTSTTPVLSLTNSANLKYGINNTWQGANTYTINSMDLIRTAKYINKIIDKKLIPTDTKNIGIVETTISFGRLPNGIWRDGN